MYNILFPKKKHKLQVSKIYLLLKLKKGDSASVSRGNALRNKYN